MPDPVLTEAIDKLAGGEALTSREAADALLAVMKGRASEVQAAAFLIALRTKGETVEELVGLAQTMRSLSTKVDAGTDELVDTCGTGGGRPTFNVSTTAAFVVAGAGCAVAKHGARSNTGKSGSADVLEALGARIDLDPEAVARCIEEVGIGFMFAQSHHSAMKHVAPVRKELAVRTVFNFLGPLTNPAGAAFQVIGVADGGYLDTIAAALGELGCRKGLVVSSEDGMDEISGAARTRVIEVHDGGIESYVTTPEELGVEPFPVSHLRAGTPERNAEITREVLAGTPGAERSVVVLNAGAAIYAGGGADSLREGVVKAGEAIDSRAAREVLDHFVRRTGELAPVK
ncbi:MAG: anthranilate phosphoribosyltransferase [Thermoleophilaceae bacterium]|nr:anthranilate phosphoribosyltransferase [Thermoleophilaceae bacterium]